MDDRGGVLLDGFVAPAYRWVPDRLTSVGEEAIDLCSQVGVPFDPEQQLAVTDILAQKRVELPDGKPTLKWASLEAAVVAPRRNIKTHVFKGVVVTDLWLLEVPEVTWTAHEFATAELAFNDMLELIDGSPLLSKRVAGITKGKGSQSIALHGPDAARVTGGAMLNFRARTKTGGRGLDGVRVILDEAFALRPLHMGTLLPTMASNSLWGNPQVLYGSSSGLVDSSILRSIRDRGRLGCDDPSKGDPGLTYLEWSAPKLPCASPSCTHHYGSDGCVLDDRELWKMANLALGRRIDIEFIATLRRSLPPEEFAREMLGWWDEPADVKAGVDAVQWAAAARRKLDPTTPAPLALDVSPGHTSGCITSYGGVAYLVEHGAGTGWMPAKLASLKADGKLGVLGIDGASPAAALLPVLTKPVVEGGAGLSIRSKDKPRGEIVLLGGREMTAACELVLAGVADGTFLHRDQQALNVAAQFAYQRRMGDTTKWSRRDSGVDISPLVAATAAFYLWSQTPKAVPLAPQSTGSRTSSKRDPGNLATVPF